MIIWYLTGWNIFYNLERIHRSGENNLNASNSEARRVILWLIWTFIELFCGFFAFFSKKSTFGGWKTPFWIILIHFGLFFAFFEQKMPFWGHFWPFWAKNALFGGWKPFLGDFWYFWAKTPPEGGVPPPLEGGIRTPFSARIGRIGVFFAQKVEKMVFFAKIGEFLSERGGGSQKSPNFVRAWRWGPEKGEFCAWFWMSGILNRRGGGVPESQNFARQRRGGDTNLERAVSPQKHVFCPPFFNPIGKKPKTSENRPDRGKIKIFTEDKFFLLRTGRFWAKSQNFWR